MFETIDYLQFGNENQQRAYSAIKNLGIMRSLSEYYPTLCGTLPIGIDIVHSDLDIIMHVEEFSLFEHKVKALFGNEQNFTFKKTSIRNTPVVKANFIFEGFEFELFGQAQRVKEQYAYLHMIVEDSILKHHPNFKEEVIKLKEQGIKTEPAFCALLGLEGDPYEALLEYGKQNGFI
ncbi:DUF4269 domain-containing protein [Psychrobacillus sp.]|uniref:DUF4269 domain-containing protein n=1 Tax=Psychrobacillus sp. TaxID=1871623 RepID=UPI0028BEC3D0|nr:DUF4269 domain-containing protein [Psychrobacillus sp.]